MTSTQEQPGTFTQKYLAEKAKVIQLVKSKTNEGRQFFLYLLSTEDQADNLKRAVAEKLDKRFMDYGEVVAWGYGHNVPFEIRLHMLLNYDFAGGEEEQIDFPPQEPTEN